MAVCPISPIENGSRVNSETLPERLCEIFSWSSRFCHPVSNARELTNPSVVKVVLDNEGYALYFSRAPIPFARDAFARAITRVPPGLPAYRHLGIYAYRAGFLRRYAQLPPAPLERFEALEQLRALAHGFRIAVAVTLRAPHAGIDTAADLRRVRRILNERRTVRRSPRR